MQIVPALTPSLIQYALGLRTIWTLTLVYIICMDVFLLSWLLSVFVVDVDLDPKRKIGATFYFYIRYLKVLFAFKGAYTRGKFLKSGTHCPTLWSLWYMVNVDYAVGSLIKNFSWSIPLYYRNSIDRIRILRQSWDEQVSLHHECEAHAGTFPPRGPWNKYEKTAAEFAEFKEKYLTL